MQHVRRAAIVASSLAAILAATSCSDSGSVSPAAPTVVPATTAVSGAAADSALAVQAKLRAAHGDSALLDYLVSTGSLWSSKKATGRPSLADSSKASQLRRQLDEIAPSLNLTYNGSTYEWDGSIPQEDADPAVILTVMRDAGSPTPFTPGYASGTVVYYGDIARNSLKWDARSTSGISLASGSVDHEGTGDYLCGEPHTVSGEQYPYSWGGLVCRYHRFTTFVTVNVNNPSECGITVTASGSAHAWKSLPFGIANVSVRGVGVSASRGARWGSSGETGAPTTTSEPLPCEFEQAGPGPKSGGPQTVTSTGWPNVSVVWWDPPVYHPEIPMPPGPSLWGVWCQVTYTFQYGRLVDMVGKCYGRESGM